MTPGGDEVTDPTGDPDLLGEVARRHGVSPETVAALAVAVADGGGTMAQFDVSELGGRGQWMRGGMTMVGDMFDHRVKARVDALCAELAELLGSGRLQSRSSRHSAWWPKEFGTPSATGGQNDIRYAYFPSARRLVVDRSGNATVYDTGDHVITGVSQQQGSGPTGLTFASQHGSFTVSALHPVGSGVPQQTPPAVGAPEPAYESILAAIERLADLRDRGILTDDEFAAKKAELLSRL